MGTGEATPGCRRGLGRARGPCSAALQPGFGVPGRSPTATTVTSSRATARRLGPRRGGRRERQPYPPRGHAGDGTEPRGPGDGGSAPRVRGAQDLRGGREGDPSGAASQGTGGAARSSRAVRGGRTVVRQEHVCGHGRLPGDDAVESVCRRAAGSGPARGPQKSRPATPRLCRGPDARGRHGPPCGARSGLAQGGLRPRGTWCTPQRVTGRVCARDRAISASQGGVRARPKTFPPRLTAVFPSPPSLPPPLPPLPRDQSSWSAHRPQRRLLCPAFASDHRPFPIITVSAHRIGIVPGSEITNPP